MKKQFAFIILSVLLAASFAGCKNRAKQLMISADKKVIGSDYAGAIADYNEAIRLSPGNSEYYFKRGFVKKFGFKNNEDGCKDMQKAMDLGYNKTLRTVVDESCKK